MTAFRRGQGAAFALAVVICASNALAGPEPGRAYVKVWDRTIVGTNAFLSGRDTLSLPETYQDHQLNLYGALGLADGLALTLDAVPFGIAAYGAESRAYIGGFGGGLQADLWRGPIVFGVHIRVGGRPDGPTIAAEVVDETSVVIEPVVGTFFGGAAGTLLWPARFGWVSARVGFEAYNARELEPVLFANAQVGLRTGSPVELSLQVQLWHAFDVPEPINVLGAGNTRYLGFDLDATWWFASGWGPFLGVGGVAYASHNAATPSLRLGVQFR